MSSFAVTVEQVTVHPHPNADRLELAQVGEFRAVVGKGQFVTGDRALYIPEQAVVPDSLIEELGLVGKLAGKDRNRVKAVRLRGEISQGIVCRPAMLDWTDQPYLADAHADAIDFAVELGIVKYVPPIPAHMSGTVEAAPDLIRWPDVENLRRYPDIFEAGEPVVATEKVHGTCCVLTFDPSGHGSIQVSSKGLGQQYLALQPETSNLYWRAVTHYLVADACAVIAVEYSARRVGVFGEVFGKGVQDLDYGASAAADDTLGYRVFDIAVDGPDGVVWLDQEEVRHWCSRFSLPMVPILYVGPYDFTTLAAVAEGKSRVGGDHIREGVVVRADPGRRSDVLGGRAIAKLINPEYLLRQGGTEFE